MKKTKKVKKKGIGKEKILKGKEPRWMKTLRKILKDGKVVRVEKIRS